MGRKTKDDADQNVRDHTAPQDAVKAKAKTGVGAVAAMPETDDVRTRWAMHI